MWIASMSVVFTDPSPEESALYNMDAVVIYFFFFILLKLKFLISQGLRHYFQKKAVPPVAPLAQQRNQKKDLRVQIRKGNVKNFLLPFFF